MVTWINDNKTYYSNFLGYKACMETFIDGRVRLIICSPEGKKILNRIYKNKKRALMTWNRCENLKY